MDETVKQKLVEAMDGENVEIFPFLPYLMQDLWEIGSDPQEMIGLLEEAGETPRRILDLGCGKGAVAVRLAQRFGAAVKGIDLIEEFILFARNKASEYDVDCRFELGDINRAVEQERDYDLTVFGAVGEVLGDQRTTLTKLMQTIRPGGCLLLDDAFLNPGQQMEGMLREEEWEQLFRDLGLRLLGMRAVLPERMEEVNRENNEFLTLRALELQRNFPDQKALFDEYLQNQLEACRELENIYTGATWLLQK